MVPGAYWHDGLSRFLTPRDIEWDAAEAEKLAGYTSGSQRIEAQKLYARTWAENNESSLGADLSDEDLEAIARREHAGTLAARDSDGGSVGAHGDAGGTSELVRELRALRVVTESQNARLDAYFETLPEEQRGRVAEILEGKARQLRAAPEDRPDEEADAEE